MNGVKNYSVAVKERGNDIVFLRRIVPGGTDRSYGVHVARLAGLPKKVIDRAQDILEEYDNCETACSVQITPRAEKRNSTYGIIVCQQSAAADFKNGCYGDDANRSLECFV